MPTCSAHCGSLPDAQREALVHAAGRIRAYHERQVAQSWSYTEADGTRLGQQVTPLDRVGIYVPGGKAAYPSSVLMNAHAGAGRRRAARSSWWCRRPTASAIRLVLAAAAICGVDRVFTIGGAQAVGALAYGTRAMPQVDKIVGPGNAYVAAAKRRVFGVVGIDMVAGPSEILVICDGNTNPGLGGDGPVLAGRARRTGAGHPAVPGLRSSSMRWPRASSVSSDEMPRREVIAASLSGARRADRGARSRRSLRDRQPHRARAPGALGRGRRSAGCRRSAMPARSSSGATPPRRWATTAPVRTTCCRLRAPRASPRRSACTISRSAPA